MQVAPIMGDCARSRPPAAVGVKPVPFDGREQAPSAVKFWKETQSMADLSRGGRLLCPVPLSAIGKMQNKANLLSNESNVKPGMSDGYGKRLRWGTNRNKANQSQLCWIRPCPDFAWDEPQGDGPAWAPLPADSAEVWTNCAYTNS